MYVYIIHKAQVGGGGGGGDIQGINTALESVLNGQIILIMLHQCDL